jgi:2-C-methyl-D-erythritol 4-phosphate cytidylyltransferase
MMIKDLGIIIAAAGTSSRFGKVDKLLEKVDGKPLFLHSIINFYSLCPLGNMIVVVAPDKLKEFESLAKTHCAEYQLTFVAGGKLRAESVRNGLIALSAQTKFVAIHDAARPWAKASLLKKCLKVARQHGGAIPAKAVIDTLKKTDAEKQIIATVKRENLWQVETPQVFNLEQLLDANKQSGKLDVEFTDDASIMEAAGYDVYIVANPDKNTKITYLKDIND